VYKRLTLEGERRRVFIETANGRGLKTPTRGEKFLKLINPVI